MRHSFVLANVAWLLVAPAIVPPCRAQETFPSVVTPIVPSVDAQPVQPPAAGGGRFAALGSTMDLHHGLSERVPADVDFMRGNTWKQLYSDVLDDQATVLRSSFQFARGHHWRPFLAVAGATAGLIALDPHDTPFFRSTTAFHGFNTAASGLNTEVGMMLVPAALYVVSARRSDSYGKQTVFLAAEAVADVQIITLAMKMIDRRIRPSDVRDGNFTDTWFKAGVFDGKSFPSGHTMTAFALADVFTERYKEHRWVPWVAYGLASVVGFSRLTLQSHFPSDVFAGGLLGVVIPHHVVLHP
jgi:membrane-associated phospholipid phosphatase